jgi:2OG-Fe(II) oxygenase superfamily
MNGVGRSLESMVEVEVAECSLTQTTTSLYSYRPISQCLPTVHHKSTIFTQMDAYQDTDTLIALVSSLLTGPVPDSAVILDALVQSDGDAHTAARMINSQRNGTGKTPVKKRKRVGDLDDWLKSSKSTHNDTDSKPVASNSKVGLGPGPSKHASPSKPVVNLMTVLRQPPPAVSSIPRLPPLTLSNPSLVAQHTPCTLHLSVLPAELACRLFYDMKDASANWQKNKWWLFDKVVESPHRTSFYARSQNGVDGREDWQEAAQYWYNGRKTEPPSVFSDAMEEACNYVEKIVNDQMRKRKRFPLEWGGAGTEGQMWRANVAASNCYEGGKESVGFHSDQLMYLGPYPTIASLSLGECTYIVCAGQINGAFCRDEQSVPPPGGCAC